MYRLKPLPHEAVSFTARDSARVHFGIHAMRRDPRLPVRALGISGAFTGSTASGSQNKNNTRKKKTRQGSDKSPLAGRKDNQYGFHCTTR